MTALTETCVECAKTATFAIPDEHDRSVIWECPACQARNSAGEDPPAEAEPAIPGVVSVADGETATAATT